MTILRKSGQLALACALAFPLSGCTAIGIGGPDSGVLAKGEIRDGAGAVIGETRLRKRGERVTLSVTAAGLAPGFHGLHVHERGLCEGPGFTSAGAHLDPSHRTHGQLSSNPRHLGDLPNLLVRPDGRAEYAEVFQQGYNSTVAEILDRNGSALVIHADKDDYKTDPTGNSGARIACAVLEPFDP